MRDRHKILACLWIAVLLLPLAGSWHAAMAQDHVEGAIAPPPAVQLPALPETSPVDEPSDPALRPHLLKGVRLQPMAKAMRLILMFDRPTAYALRQDLQYQRVYLDLINTQVGYLSADLQRIEDSRLGGVWLKRVESGLTTLELRLASPNVRIEHFSMDDPPAIVFDLERTDQDWATLPQIKARTIAIDTSPAEPGPEQATLVVTPSLGTGQEPVRPKPVVPLDQLDLLGEEFAEQVPQGPSSPPSVPLHTAETDDSLEAPQDSELTQQTPLSVERPETAQGHGKKPAEGQQLVAVQHDGSEIKPLSEEYDYFPIDAINMNSPLGEEIMNDFLYRRWASVLSKGLQYLQLNTVNEESAYLLYLMAEARWQMAAEQTQPTVLHDLQNFYSQALRVFGKGELANFAHWRLAQLSQKTGDMDGTIAHLNQSAQSAESIIQSRAQIMMARILIEQQHLDDALELLGHLKEQLPKTEEKLICTLLAGQALVMQNKYGEAWESFSQADTLYNDWEALRPDAAELKARAALHLGKYQEAREILENISVNYPYRDQGKRVRAGLLYIEVLARQGDVIKAEQFYYDIFHNLEETVRGREILEELYRLHPEDLLEGQGHYCKLLMRQGRIREAMEELNRAYNQCLKEGVSTHGLDPVIQGIVPSYLDHASRAGNYYDIVQIWWLFGSQIADRDTSLHCQSLLADAYENLGINNEALQLTGQLCNAWPSPGLPSHAEMKLRQSRLLMKNERIKEAIPQLESLVTEARDWPTLQEIYRLLAEAYSASGRDLEAAQAWQTLSQTPNLPPEDLGSALVNAGLVFLDHKMTTQTLELGLKGLIYEKELTEQTLANPDQAVGDTNAEPWGNDSGERLRTLLGRTYFERGDYDRSIIVFGDLLARPSLPDDERCKIKMQVAECHWMLGQAQQALQIYEQLADSDTTPPIWRKTATQWRDNIRWNLDNPAWAIPGDNPMQPVL